jgi:hypothetical protein
MGSSLLNSPPKMSACAVCTAASASQRQQGQQQGDNVPKVVQKSVHDYVASFLFGH